jgi:cytochrome c peroxidase
VLGVPGSRNFIYALGAVAALAVAASLSSAALAWTPDKNSLAYKLASHDPLSPAAQVGQAMFFDKSLSGSGKLSCASCHDPDHAYAPANDLAVQPGGKDMKLSGTRAVPSLRYKDFVPPYADLLDNPDGVSAPGPGGGYTQDGRAPSRAEQAEIPLLSANEMANKSGEAVVAKIRVSSYADLFRQAFGGDIFDRPKDAFAKAKEALQAFQAEDYSFHPFSSKFDLFARNKIGGTFTPAEHRGFAVFRDPKRGNCASCHYHGAGIAGTSALFTDFSYEAIGVPRNSDIPDNRNRRYYDLGICNRSDHPLPANARFCGMFKTPTLRNVTTRKVFFHNGRIKSLREAIEFYNTRDTNPERWYPTVRGVVQKFDDLPASYRANLDKQGPLDGRERDSEPPMSKQDMDDLEAFLNTLTDDYDPHQAQTAANPIPHLEALESSK